MVRIVRLVLGAITATALITGLALAGPLTSATAAPTSPEVSDTASSARHGAARSALPSASSRAKLAKRCKIKGRVLCIDKTRDKLYYVRNGRIIKTMDARFGCARTRTREGTFRVFRKRHYTVSNLYHTPMPYSMFFSGGQAVHYSADFARRGYAGCSHGCVNIRAKKTLHWVFHQIRLGDRVVVYRS